MCFPGWGTHIIRDNVLPGRGTHITRDMCFSSEGTHITRNMCFAGGGTPITRDIRFPGRRTHIGIRVSQVTFGKSLKVAGDNTGCRRILRTGHNDPK